MRRFTVLVRSVLGVTASLAVVCSQCACNTTSADSDGGGSGAGQGGRVPADDELTRELAVIDPAVDHFWGDLSAPNVIIEYGNYLCGVCGAFVAENLPGVQALVEEGRAVFAYRHFVSAEAAVLVAQASECAALQDEEAFFPYHDRVFANQSDTALETLRQYAAELGLDTEAFDACLDNAETADKVARDREGIVALGGVGTPTFLVNGQMLVGNQSVEAFEALFVDDE